MLALALAAGGFFLVPARYAASASMILVAPPSGGTLSFDPTKPVGLTNPLLQYNDSMRTVSSILILTLNSPAVQRELGIVENGPVKLTVDDGRSNADLMGMTNSGPFVHLAAEAPSGAVVQDTISRAEKRIRSELLRQQKVLGAPQGTYIAINSVTVLPPKPVWTNTITAVLGGFLLGMAGGLGVAYFVIARRRPGTPEAALVAPAEPVIAEPVTVPAPRMSPAKKDAAVLKSAEEASEAKSNGKVLVLTEEKKPDADEKPDRSGTAQVPDAELTMPLPAVRLDEPEEGE
ncbi:hypothetical protein [Nonomuraea sp. NPDC050310]|uniref:hypothetical protein n=1 Tax=unclassified Nonomuraea TaxID=2593643 RepID=UPI0034033E46